MSFDKIFHQIAQIPVNSIPPRSFYTGKSKRYATSIYNVHWLMSAQILDSDCFFFLFTAAAAAAVAVVVHINIVGVRLYKSAMMIIQ